MGADEVVSFLQGFFRRKGGDGEKGRWSPHSIRKEHVELIGKNEIYRSGSTLAGIIDGTRGDMYHFFSGVNVVKDDTRQPHRTDFKTPS